MSFLIKFIKFKQRMKFKKFELHNYVVDEMLAIRSVGEVFCLISEQ